MNEPLLTATELSYSPNVPGAVSLTLNAGDRVGLLGKDGAHLSALLQVLAGLKAPLAGQLTWRGKRLRNARALRRHVRLVWRNPYVLFGSEQSVRDLLSSRRRAITEEALRTGGMSSAVLDFKLQSLSAVQRMRVALTHLQQQQPALLLIDDVFQALIPEAWDEILRTLDATVPAATALVIASGQPAALRTMRTVYRVTELGLVSLPQEATPEGVLPHSGTTW